MKLFILAAVALATGLGSAGPAAAQERVMQNDNPRKPDIVRTERVVTVHHFDRHDNGWRRGWRRGWRGNRHCTVRWYRHRQVRRCW